jgi:NlpC/P60 family putative phage cell wall peptidase
MAETVRAAVVVAAARAWIGTPHVHGASLRGAGADCIGLVRGVWRDIHGGEPETPPVYGEDWSRASARELLWAAARRHLVARAVGEGEAGDVVLLRLRRDGPAGHAGILAADWAGCASLIHAYSRHGVVESPLGEAWRRRLVAAFAFPEGDDRWPR